LLYCIVALGEIKNFAANTVIKEKELKEAYWAIVETKGKGSFGKEALKVILDASKDEYDLW